MRKLLIIITLCVSFKISIQQPDNHDFINFGASTSRQDQDSLTCENNDVENLANRVVSLILAQDVRNANLTHPTSVDLEELQVFTEEIFSSIVLAQYSVTDLTDTFRQEERMDYFYYSLKEAVLEIIEKSCEDHYFVQSWYNYDRNRRMIQLGEFVSSSYDSHPCLCVNYQERMFLSQPVVVPNITVPDDATQLTMDSNGRIFVAETTQHHFISVSLLKAFFNKWLGNSPNANDNPNNCANTLYGRLRRSIQKVVIFMLTDRRIVTVNTWNRASTSAQSYEYLSEQIFSDYNSWMSGNIYFGPQNTGSGVELIEPDSMDSFDEAVELIIGKPRAHELKALYEDLQYFRDLDVETDLMSLIENLLSGFVLFIRISNAFTRHSVTPMDITQWELFPPTEAQLRRVDSQEMRLVLRHQKFWGIKYSRQPRNPRRHIRSADGLTDEKRKDKDIDKFSSLSPKYQWNKLVVDIMTISMQARAEDERLDWLCDFTILFNDYLFNQTAINMTDCKISGFGDYLYRKFSRSSEWSKCNSGMKVSGDWCPAWRRIVFSDVKLKYTNEKQGDKIHDASFRSDVRRIVLWLITKIQAKRCDKNKLLPPTYQENVFQSHKKINCNLDKNDLLAIKSCFAQHNIADFGYIVDSK